MTQSDKTKNPKFSDLKTLRCKKFKLLKLYLAY